MKTDYTELDAALLARIRQKPATFTELQSREIQAIADAFAADHPSRGTRNEKPAWRYIDTRLQALRKAGKIVYSGKTGWSVAP